MAQVYYVKSDELYHYGILGMKWGIRRYQNSDGTLTAAGKKRYDKAAATMNELRGSKQKTEEKEKAQAASKPKSVRDQAREMSDEDLKKAVDRLAKEKQYATLMKDLNPPQEHFFRDTLKKSLKAGFEEVSKNVIKDLMTNGVNAAMKSMSDADSKEKKAKEDKKVSHVESSKNSQAKQTSYSNTKSQKSQNSPGQKEASKEKSGQKSNGFGSSKKESSNAYEAAAAAMMFPVSSQTEIPDLSYILDMFK